MPVTLALPPVVESHLGMEGRSTVAEKSSNEDIVVKEEEIENETPAPVDVWHRCVVCQEKFQEKISLLVHLANHHADSEQYKTMSGEPDFALLCASQANTTASGPTVTQPWICEVCHKVFTYKSSLRKHRSGIHQSARPITEGINWIGQGAMPPPRKKVLHIDPDAFRGGLPCSVCSVFFLDQGQLEQHLISHWSAERPWKCEVCHLPVSRKRSLVLHRKSKHGLTNQLTEKMHNYRRQHDTDSATNPILLLLPANLLLNQPLFRIEIPPTANNGNLNCLINSNACPECNLTFETASHLEGHMINHSALRWWACEGCPALFKQQIDLKRHRVVRHQLMDPVTSEVHLIVRPRESPEAQQTPAQQELVKLRVKHQESLKKAQIRFDKPKILQQQVQLQQQPEPMMPKIGRGKKKSTKSAPAVAAEETAGSPLTTTIVQVKNSQDTEEEVPLIEQKSQKPTEKGSVSKRPRQSCPPAPIPTKPPSVSTYQARGIQWSCCSLCPAMFATKEALKEHRVVKHGEVDSSARRRSKRLKK